MLIRTFVVLAAALIASVNAGVAHAAAPREFNSSAEVLKFINDYRGRPDPARAVQAIRDMSRFGDLRNPESAGVYLGFAAGVLAANPEQAGALVDKMLPLPAEDQWLVVRAIAYSDVPKWRFLLARIRPRVPARGALVENYIAGRLPVLTQFKVEATKESWFARVGQSMSISAKQKEEPKDNPVVLNPSPELLDTFWGYYFATGYPRALQNIMALLPLSKDKDEVEKLTLGAMAKYTLAENASRDPVLLATLKTVRRAQSKEVRLVLDEAIQAADDVDVTRVRREMLASLDELKRKGSATSRNISFWGQVGQGALAAGCIAAAVAGQVELGVPCVVGGAVSSGALHLWTSQN